MSEQRTAAIGATVVVCLVLLSALVGPAMVSARPANQIPVETVSSADQPQEPTSAAWDTVPAVSVPMASAPSGLPNASDTSVESVRVQSARTDERLYIRMSWADGDADRNTTGPREFADAAAVQVPVNTSARPPISMGSDRNLVNVWYWQAGGETEELLAGGPGTTTKFEANAVETTTNYDDGRWTIVMSREIQSTAENRTSFDGDNDVDVAFAVWNGSHMERSGRKAVSEWYHFPFGPGPQGPPYESILWTIAGLAIVGVALVTIQAVRKN
ncbi:ethylbenzene dehydrogenase-related protein [Haloferax sp. DFSO52]|uniref:ethylbenzene dehydrogenase-related protein n=1 Tax=Haloferax sp. DFSO52 TaxID=3388505 RepID=UPI003A84F997